MGPGKSWINLLNSSKKFSECLLEVMCVAGNENLFLNLED